MSGQRISWFSWLLGAGLLAAVVVGAVRFSESGSYVDLLERAEASWVAVAVLLQAGTYVAPGSHLAASGRRIPP
jgi:Mg2+-importing ATPase